MDDVESYDREDDQSCDEVIRSLTYDFPRSIESFGTISQKNVSDINYLLYDEKHKETECYIECLHRFTDIPTTYDVESVYEVIESYLSDVVALHNRIREIIKELDTNEVDADYRAKNPRDTAEHLDSRLSLIIDRTNLIQFSLRIGEKYQNDFQEKLSVLENAYASAVSDFELQTKQFETTKGQFETAKGQFETVKGQFETAKGQFETVKGQFETAKEKFEEEEQKLWDANRQSTKDMITAMGIFTSIIVVIMSLVITSSSWLNNASGASAIIAFLVPSCVVVLAVCALTVFLKVLTKDEITTKAEGAPSKWDRSFLPWIVVPIATIFIGVISLWVLGSQEEKPHNRLVFEVDKYTTVDPDDASSEPIIDIHFTDRIKTVDGWHEVEIVFNSQDGSCPIHGNLIYYCITHNKFE